MLSRWDDPLVSFPVIGVEVSLLTIDQRDSLPQLARTLAAAVTDIKSDDFYYKESLTFLQPRSITFS